VEVVPGGVGVVADELVAGGGLVVVLVCVGVLVVVLVLVGVLVVELELEVVVGVVVVDDVVVGVGVVWRQSRPASAETVCTPCARFARSVGLTVAGRRWTSLARPTIAFEALSQFFWATAAEIWSSSLLRLLA
jgi:hypothetical protein